MDALTPVLLAGGPTIGGFTIEWSWIIFLVIIVVGLLLIRTAITLVKVAILVGIGIVIYLGVKFLFNNFT